MRTLVLFRSDAREDATIYRSAPYILLGVYSRAIIREVRQFYIDIALKNVKSSPLADLQYTGTPSGTPEFFARIVAVMA